MRIEVDGEKIDVEFRRGFVEIIACSFKFWLAHHAAIRASTPLREVALTTQPDVIEDRTYRRSMFIRLEGGSKVIDVTQAEIMAETWDQMRDRKTLELLAAEWPGLAFHLPPEAADWIPLRERRAELPQMRDTGQLRRSITRPAR